MTGVTAGAREDALHVGPWRPDCSPGRGKEAPTLWTVFVILLALWLLGMVASYTLHRLIHLLLVVALLVVLIRLLQGRRAP